MALDVSTVVAGTVVEAENATGTSSSRTRRRRRKQSRRPGAHRRRVTFAPSASDQGNKSGQEFTSPTSLTSIQCYERVQDKTDFWFSPEERALSAADFNAVVATLKSPDKQIYRQALVGLHSCYQDHSSSCKNHDLRIQQYLKVISINHTARGLEQYAANDTFMRRRKHYCQVMRAAQEIWLDQQELELDRGSLHGNPYNDGSATDPTKGSSEDFEEKLRQVSLQTSFSSQQVAYHLAEVDAHEALCAVFTPWGEGETSMLKTGETTTSPRCRRRSISGGAPQEPKHRQCHPKRKKAVRRASTSSLTTSPAPTLSSPDRRRRKTTARSPRRQSLNSTITAASSSKKAAQSQHNNNIVEPDLTSSCCISATIATPIASPQRRRVVPPASG